MAERAGRRALARVGHGRLRRRSRLALAEPAGELGAESSDEGKDPTVRSGGRRRGDWACAGERPQVAGNCRLALVSLNAVVDRSAAGAEGDRKTRAGHAVVDDAIAGEGEAREPLERQLQAKDANVAVVDEVVVGDQIAVAPEQVDSDPRPRSDAGGVRWDVERVVVDHLVVAEDRAAGEAGRGERRRG